MAIAGLLVHTLPQDIEVIEKKIRTMDHMESYGIHKKEYIIVVAEVDADKMEKEVEKINDIEGVLTIYTTYVTLEDEEEE